MAVLFHPTHRRFIKILRSYADRGTIISITNYDKERFFDLMERTDNALERHKSIYKLIFEILNRKTPCEQGYPFTHKMVNTIKRAFARAEFKNPYSTFLGAVVLPFHQFLNRRLKR